MFPSQLLSGLTLWWSMLKVANITLTANYNLAAWSIMRSVRWLSSWLYSLVGNSDSYERGVLPFLMCKRADSRRGAAPRFFRERGSNTLKGNRSTWGNIQNDSAHAHCLTWTWRPTRCLTENSSKSYAKSQTINVHLYWLFNKTKLYLGDFYILVISRPFTHLKSKQYCTISTLAFIFFLQWHTRKF